MMSTMTTTPSFRECISFRQRTAIVAVDPPKAVRLFDRPILRRRRPLVFDKDNNGWEFPRGQRGALGRMQPAVHSRKERCSSIGQGLKSCFTFVGLSIDFFSSKLESSFSSEEDSDCDCVAFRDCPRINEMVNVAKGLRVDHEKREHIKQ